MRIRTIIKIALALAAVIVAAAVVVSRIDVTSYKSVIAEKVKQATGRELEIAGDLRLGFSFGPALVAENIRFQNAAFGTRAEMIKAKRLQIEVSLLPLLLGHIDVRRLVLVGPDILLETDKTGRANWDFPRQDDETASMAEQDPSDPGDDMPDLGAILIEDGLLTYRDGVTGKVVKLEVMNFSGRISDRSAPLAISFDGAYNGLPFTVTGHLGALSDLTDNRSFPIDVAIRAAGADMTAKGEIVRPLKPSRADIKVNITGDDLHLWEALAGAPLPAKPYTIDTRIALKGSVVALSDLHATLGTSSLSGHADIDFAQDKPNIAASISAQKIDLADLRPTATKPLLGVQPEAARPNEGAAEKMDDGRLFSSTSFNLAPLRLLNGHLDLHVRRLVMDGIELGDLETSADLAEGRLMFDPFTAQIADGSVKGHAVFTAADSPRATLNLSLHGDKLDLAALARVLSDDDLLAGRADTMVEMTGAGDSMQALMASLNGKLQFVIGEGHVRSGYVDLLGADLLRFAASASLSDSNVTQMNCLVARFDVTKGVATTQDILFDTNRMTVRGEGNINLGTERLSLTFTPRPKETSLFSLATPWRVDGALQAPSVSLDEAGLATRAAGALLGVINPLALLVPIVTSTLSDKNPCVAALEAPTMTSPPPRDSGIGGVLDKFIPGRP